jgi:hypothetical protein
VGSIELTLTLGGAFDNLVAYANGVPVNVANPVALALSK